MSCVTLRCVKKNEVDSAGFVAAVRAWWPTVARDLPWRQVRDPWAIHVSEVMAQQTQVDRVIPKWEAFLEVFPTVYQAASARPAELIELWDGLGYNRRALLLHRCATEVVDTYGGQFPTELAGLLSLPGIGPYTARAIQAFAFERDAAVVDTNVGRVLARVWGTGFGAKDAQALADALVPVGAGWEWNQALLDFGSMVCTKRSPTCAACPAALVCSWRGRGPDPAAGSAGVSVRQSRFEGSDRQARGRLVRKLRSGSLTKPEVVEVLDLDDLERSERVLASLLKDGLVTQDGVVFALP